MKTVETAAQSAAPKEGPKAGDRAPAFSLPASGGRNVSLEAMRGRPFVLYFYPKADTPGCTREACDFQEALPALGQIAIEVIGVSPDPMARIEAFAKKFGLRFPLASDPAHTAASAYATWVKKSMFGRGYMGMERSTFLIDRSGLIARVWRKVKVSGHVAEVKAAAEQL